MEATQERRVSRRVTFKEAVRYELKDPACFSGTVAYDLSNGGLRLRLLEFLPINTQVSLNIQLENGSTAECMGRVAWITQIPYVDQFQAGIEFSNSHIMDESTQRIQTFIKDK